MNQLLPTIAISSVTKQGTWRATFQTLRIFSTENSKPVQNMIMNTPSSPRVSIWT